MKNLFLLFLLCGFISCNPLPQNSNDGTIPSPPNVHLDGGLTKPKNIILMIGDGMGITQITAGMYMNDNKLNLEKFPVIGLHKAHASSGLITDSAAAATSFASGIKTYNGAIGVNTDTVAVKTILEEAEENNLATGMVATSTIVHATPAAFIAHEKRRNLYEDIAADFLDTEIDFFVGGGKKYFDRRENDDRNLIEELEEKNYVISDYFSEELGEVMVPRSQNFGYFTADADPLPVSKGRGYLYAASKMGIKHLMRRSDKGFFLMIEGSQIDWGGHANNSDYIITEMLDFDKTIGAVHKFAEENGETLVIVTADHETGGYSIVQGSRMDSLATKFTTGYHTADMIPVFAYGPKAGIFSGIYENTAIYDKIREAFGFKGPGRELIMEENK